MVSESRETIPNVLAERYASSAMRGLWSATGKVLLERDYWIAVLKAQQSLGLPVPEGAVAAYEKAKPAVNLESIRKREELTRHDVKARLEEFCDLAGFQHLHKGLTSRDLTENVEQLQVYRGLLVLRDKAVAVASLLAQKASATRDLPLTARTHNVAAQPSTVGKRIAMFGEEHLRALDLIESLTQTYPARGLKGAVGTQLDQLTLFAGDAVKVAALEKKVLEHLGLPRQLFNTGQVYPRSLDLEVVGCLNQLVSAAASFATTLRLMAGQELATEGFAEGQVGSSAMPHKMNARSCERICGFKTLLDGYLTMASGLAGRQWNEGDVSCSVVRRVLLPDAFFAADGAMETFLTILRQMEFFAGPIEQELNRYLPFLATTTLMMEAVKAGAGREAAHEAIKKHAVAAAQAMRKGDSQRNDLADRLASDPKFGLSRSQIDAVLEKARQLTGLAGQQVDHFALQVTEWTRKYPDAARYEPEAIL